MVFDRRGPRHLNVSASRTTRRWKVYFHGGKKKIKQKHQSRLVEEKVELELLWDEGKQRLGQAARGREKRGKRAVLSEPYWKKSAALADFFFHAIFVSFETSGQTSTNFPQGSVLFSFCRPSLQGNDQPSCNRLRMCTRHCERRNTYALGKDPCGKVRKPHQLPSGPAALPFLLLTAGSRPRAAGCPAAAKSWDGSLRHRAGSSPGTRALLSPACTPNEARNS